MYMNVSISKILVAGLAGTLGLFGGSFASAQEVSGSAEVSVQVRATTSRPLPPGPRPQPLIELREEAEMRIMQLRDGMVEQRLETRAEMRGEAKSSENRNIIRDMRENAEERRERAAEIRGNIKERIEALLRSHIGGAIRRSENAINMFHNLVERMESRIDKLQAAGAATASVEASLASSVSLVATTEADLKSLQDLVASVDASSNAEEVKAQVRAAIQKVTSSIKAAHSALLSTARALAQLSATATVGAEVETSN